MESTPPGGTEESEVPHAKKKPLWQRALSAGVTAAVLVLVFGFVLPKLADYRAVIEYIGAISAIQWAILATISVWFLLAYPLVLMAAIRTLRMREAFTNHMTGTAITNSLPSGGAIALGINYAMYLSWGFTPESVSAGLLGAGVWDWYARISLPILSVFAIAIFSQALPWMWLVSIGGVIFVAVTIWFLSRLLRSQVAAEKAAAWLANLVTRVIERFNRTPPNTYDAVLQFRTDLRGIVKDRSARLTAATVSNHLAMAALYTASIYAVGVTPDQIPVPWVVLSFALGRFLVMIPVSPGGLGLVDLGWIGLLTLGWQTANPGVPVDTEIISAGVLLFRGLSLIPPIPIGMASWLYWRVNQSWRADWRVVRRGETPAT